MFRPMISNATKSGDQGSEPEGAEINRADLRIADLAEQIREKRLTFTHPGATAGTGTP